MNEIEHLIVLEKFVKSLSNYRRFDKVINYGKYEIVPSTGTAQYFSRRHFQTRMYVHSTNNSQTFTDNTSQQKHRLCITSIRRSQISFAERFGMLLEVIEPPSKEVLEKVRSEFGLNERRVREAVEHLKDWIQLQPHLPKEIGTSRNTISTVPHCS
jgi:hypothetical protein